MKGNITYIDIGIDIDIENDQREGLQCVCYQNCRQSYPTHTHAAHIVIGFVAEGAVCVRRTADCSQGGQSVLHSARHRTWNRNAWQHRIHDDQHLHSCEAEECRCWIHPAIKTDDYGSARKSLTGVLAKSSD